MKNSRRIFLCCLGILACAAASSSVHAQGTGTYFTIIPGPASPVLEPNGDGTFSPTGWFPDDRFPLTWGGANDPSVNLSWWMTRHEGQTFDTSILSPGAHWIAEGPTGSGDCRGYWIETAYRPVDFTPTLNGISATLFLFNPDNTSMSAGTIPPGANVVTSTSASPQTMPSTTGYPSTGPGSAFTITIDANYLVGFAHCEDYNSSGTVTNNSRTLYSFDNGLNWTKGPWTGYGQGGVIDSRLSGTPRLINLAPNALHSTTDIATGATGETTTTVTGFNPGLNYAYGHGSFYNRYLQQYVFPYGFWGSTDTSMNVTASGDLNNFYSGVSLPLSFSSPGGVTSANGNYPCMIGSFPQGASQNCFDMECGQLAWLYNNFGGIEGRAISFIKVPQQDITWNGGADTNLDTTANWTLTAGGAFSGFLDEQNSLTFAGGGGTLTNNLPSNIRVRGITFSSGAGAYTIGDSGNHLSLEAFTHSSTITGITNNSANTQTINPAIDVRTAALYLMTNGDGLTLNGGIDLMGSGGMVVSGTGTTTLNGAIINSGYKDFSTGAAEVVAGSNMGWVVKQGTGTLILSGNNTYTGRTDILGGVVQLANPNALQFSVVTVKTGSANSLVLTADGALGGLNGSDNLSLNGHNLSLGNSNPVQPNYPVDYTGTITGAGSITKIGTNTQLFGVANTYTGGTSIQGGTLQISTSSNTAFGTGSLTFNGGTLNATGDITANNPITLSSGGGTINTNGDTVTLNGAISGNGALISEGNGVLVLNGVNTFSGGMVVDNTVQISIGGALGTGSFQLQGGVLQFGANGVDLGTRSITITGTGSTIDSQIYSVSLEGPIISAAGVGLTKLGTGTLTWSGSGANFNGDLIVASGTFADTSAATDANFSQGNITLDGATLIVAPPGTGANITVSFAPDSGTAFTIAGSAILSLDRGSNASLTVTIGGSSNPNALDTGASSTLLIKAAGGSATLGQSTGVNLLVEGLAATPSGQLYSPDVVVAGSNDVGDFVTYNGTSGFVTFAGYTPHSGSYSQTSPTTAEVATVTGTATLAADSYAQALRLAGTANLSLNSHSYTMNGTGTTTQAGVLLDGGTISDGTLAFGANNGTIYVGGPNATLSCVISGTGGIRIFGAPGTLVHLAGNNTYSGGLVVNGTTVEEDASGLDASSGPVTVDGQGTFSTPLSITTSRAFVIGEGGGSLKVPASYSIRFSSPLTGAGDWHKTGTGTLVLNGNNTCSGDVYVHGGMLAFNGRSTFYGTSGTIYVAPGAYFSAWGWGWGGAIAKNFVITGTGINDSGALEVSGSGTYSGTVTLAGNSLIKALNDGYAETFTGLISGSKYNLTLSAPTAGLPLTINGKMNLGTGSLTISGPGGVTMGTGATASYTGSTTISSGSPFVESGVINGTSRMAVNGILSSKGTSITTAGTIEVAGGGQIVPGTLTSGVAASASLIAISGRLTMDAGSMLQVYIGNAQGISSAVDYLPGYGTILVQGTAALNGTLNLICSTSYTPASGDVLWIMLRKGGSGTFSTVNVYAAGNSTPTWTSSSLADGKPIVVNGVTGTFHYKGHNPLGLTTGDSDLSITFP